MSTSVLTLEEFLKLSTEEQEALPFKTICRFQTELMLQALNTNVLANAQAEAEVKKDSSNPEIPCRP